MNIAGRDAAVIAVMAVGTAVAAYFVAGRSPGAAALGLLIGAVGAVIPAILVRAVTGKGRD